MKKTVSLLLALLLLLSSVGFAEEKDDDFFDIVISSGEEDEESDAFSANDIVEITRPQSYEDLAVTGSFVWQVMDGFIRCIDVNTQQTAAEQPVSFLYDDTEDYLALTSCGSNVIICAVTGAESAACSVTLYELAMQDGGIVRINTMDASEGLGFLFSGQANWLEVDLIGCSGGLLVTALDPEQEYRLYLYEPVSGEIRELGTQPRSEFTAIFSFGDAVLLAGPAEDNQETMELTRISPASGGREVLGTVLTGSLSEPSCLALNEAEQTLYYFIDSIGYRAQIGGETVPEPFCAAQEGTAWLRYGAFAENRYVCLDEEGELLYQDATGILQADTLRILDLAGVETISDVLPVFNTANPGYLAIVNSGDDPDEVLTAMLNQSGDYDAYIVNLGSNLYQSLSDKGYLGDLSSSGVLTEASGVFPERISTRIQREGRLTAFPVAVQNSALLLDVAAITGMTGLSREELPTDWTGFLKLLNRIGEEELLDDSGRCLYESGISADTFRIIIMTSILQDTLLWLNRDDTRLASLQEVLTPALQALDETDWGRLGLAEDDNENTDWLPEDESLPLLEWTNPEISVMNIREGTEYWPLSVAEGGERLVPQDVAVIVLNPRSAHPEGVVRFTETLWEEMDIITRMELDRSLNDPVENDSFDEDIAFLQAFIPMYEEAIAAAESEEEAAELQAELEEMRAFLESYEEAGTWLVSSESITLYRSLEDLFAIHGDEFWYNDAENSGFLQYVDRMLDPVLFVRQLVNTLQMSRMETE